MTRQAKRGIRVVHDQKGLRSRVQPLHVRLMATGALHVAVDHLHRRGAGRSTGDNARQHVVCRLQRQLEIERMHGLQAARGCNQVVTDHRSAHFDVAIRSVLPGRHRAVMAAEAKITGGAKRRLLRHVR